MATRDEFEAVDRREVEVPADHTELDANLVVPADARGVVVIAGGTRDDAVLGRLARDLQEGRLATLLLHLRTPDEARQHAPDAGERDGGRIAGACAWLGREPRATRLGRGVLALGAAVPSALLAAAEPDAGVRAVVGVDGHFDGGALAAEPAVPVLLLASDDELVPANRAALARVTGERELQVVRSSHRAIEERIEAISGATARWFGRHLR